MGYSEAVRYLFSLGNEVKSAKLGLERMALLLERLGRPERAFSSIHIAGTNGKGSTAAMIESGLRAGGRCTGLYTSPHLVRVNERIQVLGRVISDRAFMEVFERVQAAIEQLLAENALACHPTFFECVTAMGFCHFREEGVEMAVVEVGLGGRLDATNVLAPQLAVITAIDWDHEAWLGRTLAAIASEKAGILKRGVPAVFAAQQPEAAKVLENRARELEISVIRAGGDDWRAEQMSDENGFYRFVAAGKRGRRIDAALNMAGEHQVANALTAIAALDLAGLPQEAIEQGLRTARWPGRLQQVGNAPLVLLDGAHNPAGARALAGYVERHQGGRRIWLIYGAMRDKAIDEVAGLLFSMADRVLLTRVDSSRALSPETLRALVGHLHPNIQVHGTLAEALQVARAGADKSDIILVTGSLYLVGEAMKLLDILPGA